MKLPLWAKDYNGQYRNFPMELFTQGRDGKWRMRCDPLNATLEQYFCIRFFGHLMIKKAVGECSAGTIYHYIVKTPPGSKQK